MGGTAPRFDLDGSGHVDVGDVYVVFDDFTPAARAKALRIASQAGLLVGPVLAQNAPNPCNSRTSITYRTALAGPVALTVLDLSGQRVHRLVAQAQEAGVHSASWDGRDDVGRPVASGYQHLPVARGRADGAEEAVAAALRRIR